MHLRSSHQTLDFNSKGTRIEILTPELYIKFNSPDDVEADRANEDWEAAIRAYRSHLNGLQDQMPPQVKKLAGLCLHDAELLACKRLDGWLSLRFPFERSPFWPECAILSARQGNEIFSLIYVLGDAIRRHESKESWPFSKLRRHWLYDEVDVAQTEPWMFLHRVLLSDGIVMEIPFVTAFIHSFSLQDGDPSDASRQIA
jgi:hypothetical protein